MATARTKSRMDRRGPVRACHSAVEAGCRQQSSCALCPQSTGGLHLSLTGRASLSAEGNDHCYLMINMIPSLPHDSEMLAANLAECVGGNKKTGDKQNLPPALLALLSLTPPPYNAN